MNKHTADQRYLYFLGGQYVGVTHTPQATAMLEPRASEYTYIPVVQCVAAPDLLAEAIKAVEAMANAGLGFNETGLRAAIAKATQP